MILKCILEKREGGLMDWFDLALDSDKWWALVKAVITFGFHTLRGIL
jgi:hypothetical protein